MTPWVPSIPPSSAFVRTWCTSFALPKPGCGRTSGPPKLGPAQHVEATAAGTRRHFDVVGEGLLGKIELVAEGLATLDQRMERFRGEVHENFAKVDRRLLRLEARILSGPEGR